MRLRSLILVVVIAACGGESSPTGPDGPVPTTQVYKSQLSGIRARRGEIISRESRWIEVWDEITSGQSPKPALPQVDFNTRLLVLAALGETADSCKSVKVASVERDAGALDITLAETRLPSNCACPPVVVQPVHVVSAARAATDARFAWTSVTEGTCGVTSFFFPFSTGGGERKKERCDPTIYSAIDIAHAATPALRPDRVEVACIGGAGLCGGESVGGDRRDRQTL